MIFVTLFHFKKCFLVNIVQVQFVRCFGLIAESKVLVFEDLGLSNQLTFLLESLIAFKH